MRNLIFGLALALFCFFTPPWVRGQNNGDVIYGWSFPDAEVLVVWLPEGDVVEVVPGEGGQDGEDGRDHLRELVAQFIGSHEKPLGGRQALSVSNSNSPKVDG